MSPIIFKTEDAIFQFDQKAVIECLEKRKLLNESRELDTLIEVLSNQPEQPILSSAEHQYFGFIALDLINISEGSVICKNCGEKYRFNKIEVFTVGPDEATLKAAAAKKGRFKSLFRKKLKLSGIYGGNGYRCPRGHTLIFMVTWRT